MRITIRVKNLESERTSPVLGGSSVFIILFSAALTSLFLLRGKEAIKRYEIISPTSNALCCSSISHHKADPCSLLAGMYSRNFS